MTLSDRIAARIIEMLEKSDGETEIQRNTLASSIGCVPSQINYVITSRFTPENGYVVFSQRGGGGYIRISRVNTDKSLMLMHIVNSFSDRIDMASLRAVVQSLYYDRIIDLQRARLVLAGCDDNALRPAPAELRDTLRASIAKQLLLTNCE